jgi:hypothetical protein
VVSYLNSGIPVCFLGRSEVSRLACERMEERL